MLDTEHVALVLHIVSCVCLCAELLFHISCTQLRWPGNKTEVEKREWWRGIVDELLLSCPVCSLERILHFVIANSFIRSINDDKIELNRYDKIENCLNVSLSANF